MEMKLKGNVTNQIIHAETRQVMQPVQNNMEHVKYIPGVEEERDSGSSLREGGKAGRREGGKDRRREGGREGLDGGREGGTGGREGGTGWREGGTGGREGGTGGREGGIAESGECVLTP